MATRTRTQPQQRIPERDQDEARFQAWLNDFDARHAEVAARLDALLRTLGVDPARTPERETV